MTTRVVLFLWFFVSALLEPVSSAVAQLQEVASRAEIQRVLQSQQDAWNRGEIDAFMNGYARGEDTIFVSEDKIERGWENVRDRYRKKYSDRSKMGTLTFSDLEISILSPDAAVVLGRWSLKRERDQPHGCFTLIFRLTKDGWRIAQDHTSAAAPPK